ncbi:radical SAM family heme chaperone HemW [Parvimonas micra]|uniref:Heme chaperone HemW n=1 Tax=Parvimonas micra ATCC 33270 TaxID=411465 RepID=A8SJD3_9FIRM|nr:radical SAM family heme chaperone HemW [Parvimonas micra]EDP24427.1 putative oxygen-independent coproporphyrinogen III oxidase [Parvimonas micra ATCC 33270]MEB3059960.1 radical SAM family heme chaperone HemW [Parvimonas micra]MEB3067132.1 radical SAM family heme chaperone HemW [Parvimonas micra]RSB91295.1 radical SAM family heme chaperone HemW [Parvimonas micra]VEH94976.1 Oxygen-independent coproporphyrinogen-III oxidase [Parvimonas micra]
MKRLGLYIHIPFCDRICNYCDFTAFQGANSKIKEYVEALKKEIELKGNKNFLIDSIFIGGGTPSFIDGKYIFEILEKVKENFTVLDNIEISIETNPKTFDKRKLEYYKSAKINRVSIGVQSFNDVILKELGRNHNSKEAFDSIELVKKFDFDINLDLIFGYQSQTIEDILYDLEMVKNINPEHISYYALIIEEKTKFKALQNAGKLDFLDEETERKMYHLIVEKLEEMGMNQYEVSNFAKVGKESVHNKKYWNCKEYLGLGISAHSYLNDERFSNTVNLSKYIKELYNGNIPVDFREKLDMPTKKFEYIIMNMRLKEGFLISDYNRLFESDFLEENKKAVKIGLENNVVEIKDDRIYFTKRGFDIMDSFFVNCNLKETR